MPAPVNAPLRVWTNYFTTLANANQQTFTFSTPDDYRDRWIESIFLGIATAGVNVQLQITGQEYSMIDTTRFAAGDAVLKTEFKAPAKMQLQILLQDIAGAAHVNVPVVIGYRVDPNAGP